MPRESSASLILVADDDLHIVCLLGLYLAKAGDSVESAADGDEPLRQIWELPPDLLVLDIMMPGPDGLDVCGSVRRASGLPSAEVYAGGRPGDAVGWAHGA